VVAWGSNTDGQTEVPSGLTDVVQISAGYDHSLALKRDGTVVAWGSNTDGQTEVPSGLTDVVQVVAGFTHSVAVRSDGTVVSWGSPATAQAGFAANLRNVTGLSVGAEHSVALIPQETRLAAAASKPPFDNAWVDHWSSEGSSWLVDQVTSRDGIESVKAQTTNGQSTYREYTVTGPAVVDFWWKVSSEQIYDTFSYSVNGVNQETISGEVDWTYRTLTLPAGAHTIRWTYDKDAADGIGQDAGWLDDFAVYPATPTLRVRDGSTVLNGTVTLDFGDSDLGSAGFTKTLNLANEGYVPQEIELTLPAGSPFTFEGGSSTYSTLLGRGENVSVPIYLATQSSGTKTAALTITAPDSTATTPQITLTGDVLGPVVGVSLGATTLTSGQTADMGLAPKTLEFTIRNNGNIGNLDITQITTTGNFQIVQQPAASVAPQNTTTFKVLAMSGAFGSQTGSVVVTSNDGFTPTFTINLTSKAFLGIGSGISNGSVATSGTGGALGWDFASTQLPSGSTGQAIKTGATPNNGGSALEMVAQTAGAVSWSWKVSAQENFDWLLCEVDGQEVAGISTKNGAWQTQVVQVPAGANVRWIYRKDASGSAGEDAGYLAEVAFAPMSSNLSFAEWAFARGITDQNARLPRSGMRAAFAWLGGIDPLAGPDAGHYKPFMEGGRLKYRFRMSKSANATQRVQVSGDLGVWTTRNLSQQIIGEDANALVVEAAVAGGGKGFLRLLGSGDLYDMQSMIDVLSFDLASLIGNEASAASNFNDIGLSAATISRGSGLVASANSGRFNATSWAVNSIADAISGNKYMEFTITPSAGKSFVVSTIAVQWQRSATGNVQIVLRSSLDGYSSNIDGVKNVVDNTATQSFTWTVNQSAPAIPVTYRFYSFAESPSASGGIGDGTGNDLVVRGAVFPSN